MILLFRRPWYFNLLQYTPKWGTPSWKRIFELITDGADLFCDQACSISTPYLWQFDSGQRRDRGVDDSIKEFCFRSVRVAVVVVPLLLEHSILHDVKVDLAELLKIKIDSKIKIFCETMYLESTKRCGDFEIEMAESSESWTLKDLIVVRFRHPLFESSPFVHL